MKRLAVVVLLVPFLFFLSCKGCNGSKKKRRAMGEDVFSFRTLDGKLHHFQDYRGKVLLVEFFASWCPSCRYAIPHTAELYKKYKDKGLEVVGLSFDQEDLDVIKKKFSVPFPMGYAPEDLARHFHISAIPAFFIFDRNGRFAGKFVGYNDAIGKSMAEKVKALLAGG